MSDVYRKGLSPQTRSISSSRNRLYARSSEQTGSGDIKVIGVVSNFSPQDARTNETVRGIGFGDQIAELVPGMSEAIQISISRTALYEMNIFQALGYKGGVDGLVRAIKHHRWPFDLRQEVVISEVPFSETEMLASQVDATMSPEGSAEPGSKVIATLYAGCWFASYSSTFSADTAIVAEEVTLNATDIFALSAGGATPQVPYTDGGEDFSSILKPRQRG